MTSIGERMLWGGLGDDQGFMWRGLLAWSMNEDFLTRDALGEQHSNIFARNISEE